MAESAKWMCLVTKSDTTLKSITWVFEIRLHFPLISQISCWIPLASLQIFIIKVIREGHQVPSFVFRRYSEFQELNQKLVMTFPLVKLPSLTGKWVDATVYQLLWPLKSQIHYLQLSLCVKWLAIVVLLCLTLLIFYVMLLCWSWTLLLLQSPPWPNSCAECGGVQKTRVGWLLETAACSCTWNCWCTWFSPANPRMADFSSVN